MYEDKDLQRLYDENYFSTRKRPPMWKRRAEFIVEKFNPQTALDIGCSWGELVKSLNDLNVNAFGIDGSDFAISHVDPTIKHIVFKVNLNNGSFPFDSDTFDLITGFYVIEHIHNMNFFAKELYRTLKSNGTIWFLTPNEGVKGRNDRDVFTNKFNQWKKTFEEYNFNVTKFSPHEMLTLRGKLATFKFYKLPKSTQNIIKRLAYDFSNRLTMKDTSFIMTKN